MNGGITYEQSLAEMIRSEPTASILNRFWQQSPSWPKGNEEMIFLGDAILRVGKLKFREDWTGTEIEAQRRISRISPFSGTLEYYWAKVRSTFPDGTFPASPQADWEGEIPPPFAIPTPISAADLKRLQHARARRLERDSSALKSCYEKFAGEAEKRKLANDSARVRLEWAVAWIADHGRVGKLKTSLRPVRTDHAAGVYIEAHKGIWETENIIQSRLGKGYIKFDVGNGILEDYYVFFNYNSFEQNLGDLFPFDAPPEFKDIHLSPYIKSMIETIQFLKITSANQPKKAMLAAYLIETWRGPNPLPKKMAERMATVMRETNSQKGAHKHKKDD